MAFTAGADDPPTTYAVSAEQARQVTTLVQFVRAYNRRQLRAASSLLTADVLVGDCDYRRGVGVLFRGRVAAVRWLRQRFADRDTLVLKRVFNENPDSATVAGVEFSSRSSNTLRALGFQSGIQPKGVAKVVFPSPERISVFSNGDDTICRIR